MGVPQAVYGGVPILLLRTAVRLELPSRAGRARYAYKVAREVEQRAVTAYKLVLVCTVLPQALVPVQQPGSLPGKPAQASANKI